MQAHVSLWSADLLDVGSAIDAVGGDVDGFHVDVMDGHYVPELLFGPDFVRAVCTRTTVPVEVHLMVTEADRWIAPFVDAGCAAIGVHARSTENLSSTLGTIRERGARPSLAIEVDEPTSGLEPYLELVDRILVMGTALGIKGVDIDPQTYLRVGEIVAMRDRTRRRPEIVVDGGIRRHTVPQLAEAGADGVVPGSLVLADENARGAVAWIKSLRPEAQVPAER
jgi:ribulose-phosphate 3-epimerase